jgi:hypothetical protein
MQFTIQQCGSEPGEPNETLAQATPITAPTTLTRLLCPSGDADWYSFTNTGQSVANITMTPPSGRNYDLSLQSAGGVIAVSAASGSTPESISTCLGAGTFYIVVTGAGGASDPFATYSLSLSLTTPSPPPPQTTSSGPIQMASGNWHPVLQNFNFVGPNGPCTRTVQITISGSHTVTCTSPTAAIKWYDLSLPFPQTLASTTLTAAGTYSVTASFTAQPGHSYGFGLYVSGQTPTCPVTVGGTMTVR